LKQFLNGMLNHQDFLKYEIKTSLRLIFKIKV